MQESNEQSLNEAEKRGIVKFHDDRKKIEYPAISRKERFTDPEEMVRALYYIDLITKYSYPADRIEFETEMPSRVPKYFADIVVYEDDAKKKPYIVIECKKDGISDAEFEQATKQAIGNSRVLRAPYSVCVAGNTQRVIETDRWNDKTPDEATIADIPVSYGKIEEWRFRKGDKNWELKTVERQELIKALEKSHDTLWAGGKRNPTVAFDELCKIIFVKTWDEKHTRKAGEPYSFQIKTHEKASDVQKRIEAIYQEAKTRDPEVFTEDIKVTEQELYAVVQHLQELSLTGTDLDTKGVAFERFMEDFFKGKSGQYFTPRNIVHFAVQIMKVNNEDYVLDPACGSGGFLLYALDAIRKQADEIYGKHPIGQDAIDHHQYWHNFAEKNLYGIEINDSLARVAKMNMIIHDDGHTNVIRHDGLDSVHSMHIKNQGFAKGKFDFILTNPPFGAMVKKSEHQYITEYELGKNGKKVRDNQKTEILFIERCVDFLKPGTGRMAIVLPDGILTNSSLQYVRDFLMEKCQILAVVSLPTFAFSHYGAGVKSSVVFVRKKAKDESLGRYQIFMAQAEHIGYDATGRDDKQNDLTEIAEAYADFSK
jgi:type I restriction enzyme M protein